MSPCSKVSYGIGVLILLSIAILSAYFVWRAQSASKNLKKLEQVCPACEDGIMCPLRSLSVKMCQSCGHTESWKLKDGQLPLVANNRQVKRK